MSGAFGTAPFSLHDRSHSARLHPRLCGQREAPPQAAHGAGATARGRGPGQGRRAGAAGPRASPGDPACRGARNPRVPVTTHREPPPALRGPGPHGPQGPHSRSRQRGLRVSRRARAHSPRPAAPPPTRSRSATLHPSALLTHNRKAGSLPPRPRGSAGGPSCKHLELRSLVEAGGSGEGPAAALRRRDVCLARSHGCHGNPPLADWPAGSGSQSDANGLLKAGPLTCHPLPSGPLSTFQRLAVQPSLSPLFRIWLA